MKLFKFAVGLLFCLSVPGSDADSNLKQEQIIMFCTAAIAGISNAAYQAPTNTYELPIFSEDLDNQLAVFLQAASGLANDPGVIGDAALNVSLQAQEVYAAIKNEKPEILAHCEQSATKLWGDCNEKNFDSCAKEKAASEAGQNFQTELAQSMSELILRKTKLGKVMSAMQEPIDLKEADEALEPQPSNEPTGISTRNLVILAALGWLIFFVILFLVLKRTRKNSNKP